MATIRQPPTKPVTHFAAQSNPSGQQQLHCQAPQLVEWVEWDEAQTVYDILTEFDKRLDSVDTQLADIKKLLTGVVGIKVTPGAPTTHPVSNPPVSKESAMSAPTIKLVNKSSSKKAKAAAGSGAVVNFQLQDNGDDTFTVNGVDAGGNVVDISTVATLAVTSDNTAVLTVDAPVGMTSAMHAVGPVGAANVVAVATWKDGSLGPFTVTLPVTVTSGGATGIQIVPGTPTVH